MMKIENTRDNAIFFDALTSVLKVALLNLGDKSAYHEANTHISRLQHLGAGFITLTVKGVPISDPEIFMYEFPIMPANFRRGV
jgi:hypothetical protein